MKNTSKNILFCSLAFLILLFSSCETVDLDGLKNDNEKGSELSDPVYGFNYVQVVLADFVNNANNITQDLTRQYAMTSGKTYDNAFEPVNSNDIWISAYSILGTIKSYESKAIANNQFELLGASKIVKAYVMFSLVDLFGDVPYSEALLGNENLNPAYDSGAIVYKKALAELDEAIVLLDKPLNSTLVANRPYDLFYGTTAEKVLGKTNWKTLANTLKFRAYVTARKNNIALGVNLNSELSVLMAGNLIDTPSEDFAFKYGIDDTTLPFSSRHPAFNNAYIRGFSPSYISNYMLWTMVREKPKLSTLPSQQDLNLIDPRVPYYFYNQSSDVYANDTFTLPGKFASRPDHYNDPKYTSFYRANRLTPYIFTRVSASSNTSAFWGSDHGNNAGRPQDGDKVTIVGVYPAGGKYGGGSSPQTDSGTAGEKGAGIMPIVMSSFTRFLKAEAYLTVFNDPILAKVEMDAGINASIDKASKLFPSLPQPVPADVTAYQFFVDDFYNNNPSKQLEVIMKEFFIAAWGNGIETYNNYRRTGFPGNFQPTIELNSGAYYNTLLYPSDSQSNNSNRPPNFRSRRVFWDINSPILN